MKKPGGTKKTGKKLGRRCKWSSHVEPRLFEIKCWAREGLIEEEMCKRLGVGVSTFNVYKNDHPELVEVLKEGKEFADYLVEDALYRRAKGYDLDDIRVEEIRNLEGELVSRKVIKRKTHIPPEVRAIEDWLFNRQRGKWKNLRSGFINRDMPAGGDPVSTLQEMADLLAQRDNQDKRKEDPA